jgi:hypothetical protein
MDQKGPGIYLIYLGSYKDLKSKFNFDSKTLKYRTFDDTDGIYKFGKTINLTQRISQHKTYYESIIGQGMIHREFKLQCVKALSDSISNKNLRPSVQEAKLFNVDSNFGIQEAKLFNVDSNVGIQRILTRLENSVKEFCIDNNFHFIEDSSIDTHHNELVIIKNTKLKLIEEFIKELK